MPEGVPSGLNYQCFIIVFYPFAETRLQKDRPEGRAKDPRGGPADRKPERAMTISSLTPLAEIDTDRTGWEDTGGRMGGHGREGGRLVVDRREADPKCRVKY